MGVVGHDAVHAEADQKPHFLGIVDGPVVDGHVVAVGRVHQSLGGQRDAVFLHG